MNKIEVSLGEKITINNDFSVRVVIIGGDIIGLSIETKAGLQVKAVDLPDHFCTSILQLNKSGR